MNSFRLKSPNKRSQDKELNITEITENKYSVLSVLAQSILIVLIVYGAIGGFLSAYYISYNRIYCVVSTFAVALFMSAVYESGRKLCINTLSFMGLGSVLYLVWQKYWYLNSGYYAIVNRIYEEGRLYLGVANRTEYAETVENQYLTVTYFAMFIGMVGAMLLCIHFAHKIRFWMIAFITFIPFLIPLYFERMPDSGFLVCMFTGYILLWITRSGILEEQNQLMGRMALYILPVILIATFLFVTFFSNLFSRPLYNSVVPANREKLASEDTMSRIFLFGAAAMFGRGANAGIGGGTLEGITSVRPDYQTDLIVRYTPYDNKPIYLKAFTSMRYENNRWFPAKEDMSETAFETADTLTAKALKETFQKQAGSTNGKGIMKIVKADKNIPYDFSPYYQDSSITTKRGEQTVSIHTYYTYTDEVSAPALDEEVLAGYLNVPESCYEAVRQVCEREEFTGDSQAVANRIVSFFDREYTYTLRPGYAVGNKDYITRFLLQSKKGFCAHFASAATMMFRYMGIPARFVEGYVFSYNEALSVGELVEDAKYSDYFEGYSKMGETGLVELEIPDANAHAWVEIYIDGKGWIVVDPTPAADGEVEDYGSFWEAFRGKNASDIEDDLVDTEAILDAGMDTVKVAIMVFVILGLGYHILNRVREVRRIAALPGKQQIHEHYRRLVEKYGKKNRELRKCRTIDMQVGCIYDMVYGKSKNPEIYKERKEKTTKLLYQVFYAPDISSGDCEYLLEECKKLQKSYFLLTR